jgi:micrococcal nuclease
MKIPDFLYHYRAFVTGVYDGDSITVRFDYGFNLIQSNQKIRLYGINAPEIRGDSRRSGLKSRDWLREKILDKNIIIQTYKDKKGKYGRWLGIIYEITEDGEMINLNDQMVSLGLAVQYLV